MTIEKKNEKMMKLNVSVKRSGVFLFPFSWTECWIMRYTVPQRFATSCKGAQHNGSGAARSINAK